MRHQKRRKRLGVKSPHRIAMLRNLTLGLVEHGRIKTTVARAKVLRPFVEKLVTKLKDPTVPNIRIAKSILPNTDAVVSLYTNVSPKFKDRPGGYLRILKLATPRAGDNADMALVEWVDKSLVKAYSDLDSSSEGSSSKKTKAKSSAKSAKSSKKAPSASKKAKDSTEE
jgi:large subunit ribosomal protein L17